MNDEFLHRLRKEPRPEFAALLQARLRRQSTSSLRYRAPSRARTLLTLLLLGGTAFAVTAVAIRGLPPAFFALYQQATAWIAAERRPAPAHRVSKEGIAAGLRWGASPARSAPAAAVRGSAATQSAAEAMSAHSAATSAAESSGGSSPAGAPGSQIPQITVVSSWAAYPYAAAIVERLNSARDTTGRPIVPHINVSVRNSDVSPGTMCLSGAAHPPDLLYTFQPVGSVMNPPCRADSSGNLSRAIAIPIGYEAVALARSPLYGELDLTRRQVYLALAKWVPDPARPGAVHENPNATWRQINAALGPESIEFMGPPLSSAAGHSMISLLVEGGCNTYPWIAALADTHPNRYARICRTVRTNGVYVEESELSPARLLGEPNAVGIFGLGYQYDPLLKELAVSRLDGVELTQQNIENGAYPGSRGFYLIVNRERIAPNVIFPLLTDERLSYPDWALVLPSRPESLAAIDQALSLGP
jgi:phosphate transport system substrate-binding protein